MKRNLYLSLIALFTGASLLHAQCNCTTPIVPPTTFNGITMTSTSTGSVGTYGPAFPSCGGAPTPANSLYLGQSGAFSYTLNLSAPIQGLCVVITATGGTINENFIFTTNSGNPAITAQSSCFSTIVGNQILSGAGAPANTGGGGVFQVLGTNSFTSLTITGSGGQNGSLFAFCLNSIIPPTSGLQGDIEVCQNDTEPDVTFSATGGVSPYTFTYNINGGTSQTVTSVGDTAFVAVPTTVADTFFYELESAVDSNGTAISQTDTVIVIVHPLPEAELYGDTIVCEGSAPPEVAFVGSNSSPPYTFTYTIDGGPPQTVSTTTGDTAYVSVPTTTAGTFSYELVSVSDSSNAICSQAQEDTVVVVVNPLPQATLAGDTTVCQDATAPELIFVGSNATAPYTFTYTINGGAQQTVTSTGDTAFVSVPTTVADTFVYNLISVEDASAATCSQLTIDSATVIVEPTIDYTLLGNTSVCENGPEPQVTLVGENGTSPYTFTYTINGGSPQTINTFGDTAFLNVPTNVIGDFSYEVIDLSDASTLSCINFQADTVLVTVNATPVASWNTNDLCLNQSSVLTNTSTVQGSNGAVIDSWDWDYDDGNGSTQENPTHNFTQEGEYDVSLIVTTNQGCSDTLSQLVSVWPLPVVDFSSTEECEGNATVFTDQSTVSNAITNNTIANWSWSYGDGGTATTQNPSHTYSTSGSYNVTLTATTNNGCTSDVTLPVIVYATPVADFTGINLEACSGTCPELTSTSAVDGPSTIVNYEWFMSNGTTQSGSSTTFTECLTNETSNTQFYDVALTVTTAQGCQNTYLETDYVLVYAQPVASFYFEPDAPTTLDSEVDFVNTSDNAENYSWDFAGLGVSSSINPTFEFPEEAETYSVQLIAFTNEGCADTTRMDVEIFEDIIFYVPNTFTPDGNSYNEVFQPIFYSGFDPQDYKLLIYNRWGEVLYESNDASIGWDGTYGGKRVKEGTYVWKIEFKEKLTDERQNHTGHVNVLR